MAEENVGLSQEKMLKQLKASFDMYENTKKSTEKRMKTALNKDGTKKYTQADIEKELELISEAEEDVIKLYVESGGKEEDLRKKKKTSSTKQKSEVGNANIVDMMAKMEDDRKKKVENAINSVSTKLEQEYIPQKGSYNPEAAFDVIPLPSKGEGYKDKISKASVAYLTAYDENMIVSPNLYRDNLILDYLIQEKLINLNHAYKSGNSEELLRASLLPTEQKVRTIMDVLTSNSRDYALQLWNENRTGKPCNQIGHKHVGKWYFIIHGLEKDKYNRDYINGELKANDRYCLWIEGIKLDIYDKEFIDTIKNFLGSKPITYDNNECIPESVIRINKAQMFFYKFSSPLYNKRQNRTWRNGMPRTIPAINVFGIVKEVIDDKIVFYEGWDPNERGKKIAEKFFEK